jgi:hypothetical protein
MLLINTEQLSVESKSFLKSVSKKQWVIGGVLILTVGTFLVYNLGWFKGKMNK